MAFTQDGSSVPYCTAVKGEYQQRTGAVRRRRLGGGPRRSHIPGELLGRCTVRVQQWNPDSCRDPHCHCHEHNVAVSPSPGIDGQPVTFTATVSPCRMAARSRSPAATGRYRGAVR